MHRSPSPIYASAEELRKFAKLVNDDGETTANAVLTANIDLSSVCGPELNDGSSVSWTPIGSISNKYRGNFNGQNFKISGLYIDTTANYQVFLAISAPTVTTPAPCKTSPSRAASKATTTSAALWG